jgi:hypothetical protein
VVVGAVAEVLGLSTGVPVVVPGLLVGVEVLLDVDVVLAGEVVATQ